MKRPGEAFYEVAFACPNIFIGKKNTWSILIILRVSERFAGLYYERIIADDFAVMEPDRIIDFIWNALGGYQVLWVGLQQGG